MTTSNLKSVPDETPQPAQDEPTHVTISVQTANKVLLYLLNQPFKDVFEILPEFKIQCDKSFLQQKGE